MATKKTGLIFLTKNSIDLYLPEIGDIIHYAFPPTIVQDMDVVNNQELINQLALFSQTNNITGVTFTMLIYDDLIFGKEIKNIPLDKQVDVIKTFISSVPFEYTIVKEIKSKESMMVFATNSALIDCIVEGFQKNGNMLSYASISYFILQGIDVTNGFTRQVAEEALKKTEQIKEYSFISEEKATTISEPEQKNTEDMPFLKNPKNKRTIILSAVFVALVGVLIVVYTVTNSANSKNIAQKPTPAKPVQVASVSPTAPIAKSITLPTETKIQVRTSDLQRFGKLQTSLSELNFQNIELDTKNVTLGSKTIVVFDPTVSSSIQQNILEVLKAIDTNVTTQTSPVSQFHVVITLSR